MEPTPSKTLYINNINEKIKPDVVKKMLYMVFSQYGKVTDVVAKKGLKLRGQAWVVFEEESSAVNALRGKQGFSFYEKPLALQFSKNKTDLSRKNDVFEVSLKRKRDPTVDEDDEADADDDEGDNTALVQDKE